MNGEEWQTRGSNVSTRALLNLVKELRKIDKMRGVRAFYRFFATRLTSGQYGSCIMDFLLSPSGVGQDGVVQSIYLD